MEQEQGPPENVISPQEEEPPIVVPPILEDIIVDPIVDPTGWMINNPFADFVLMHTIEIRFMCMIGYAFFGGHKVFSGAGPTASASYKMASMIFTCTGGGIMVPLFINGIPVPLANDYFIMAMVIAFAIHHYFPVIREVYKLSPILKACVIILFETFRASVVFKLTLLSATKIPSSMFSFPFFGPIFCGAIAGCGGAFLPLNKGLEPIKKGLASPMFSALVGATATHIFLNTPLSDNCFEAPEKAHVHLTGYFIFVGLVNAFGCSSDDEKMSVKKK